MAQQIRAADQGDDFSFLNQRQMVNVLFEHEMHSLKHGGIRVERLEGARHHLAYRCLRSQARRKHPAAQISVGNNPGGIIRHQHRTDERLPHCPCRLRHRGNRLNKNRRALH